MVSGKSRVLLEQEIRQQMESLTSLGLLSYDGQRNHLQPHHGSEELSSHTNSLDAYHQQQSQLEAATGPISSIDKQQIHKITNLSSSANRNQSENLNF
jgi:hypothetical protein